MDLPTSAQPQKRKIQYEAAESSTDPQRKKRQELVVQLEGDEKSKVIINRLCTVCEDIFASAKDRHRRFSWFYDILGLLESVEKGCHFCAQVLREIPRGVIECFKQEIAEVDVEEPHSQSDSHPVEKRLKVETRYYKRRGVAFMLRRSHGGQFDTLATIALYFNQYPGKCSYTSKLPSPNFPCVDELSIGNLESHLVGAQTTLHHIYRWIEQCTSEHAMCKPSFAGSPRDKWPSRLVAVGTHSSATIRLCETSTLAPLKLLYATLSHCWGNFVPLRLLTTNISSFLHGIALDSLPRTFQDAVEMTRNLGLGYLWIDSLCILQDSTQDWAAESNRMYETYRYSFVNLAAVASANASEGLTYPSSLLSTTPCKVMIGRGQPEAWARTDYTPGIRSDNNSDLPLLTRAWVFQEILLPSRVLLFTKDEVCWECNEMSRTETFPDSKTIPRPDVAGNYEVNEVIPFRKTWRNLSEQSPDSRIQLWNQMIAQYSGNQMSKPSDKLVAMAGLAHDLGQNWPRVDYLAGLWSYDLLHGLLWNCRRCTRSRFYNAPSWSWASVDGSVTTPSYLNLGFCDPLVEIVEACTTLTVPTMTYGAVADGYIRLKGALFQAEIKRQIDGRIDRHTIRFLDDTFTEICDGVMLTKIEVHALWDDEGFKEICVTLKIFLMPFEIYMTPDFGDLKMRGIILSPLGSHKGQYRRIGFFEIQDQLSASINHDSPSPDSESIARTTPSELTDPALLCSNKIMDEVLPIDDSSQEPLIDDAETPDITIFDAEQWVGEAEREEEKLPRYPEINPLSKRSSRSNASSKWDPSSKNDIYCNGVVDMTLRRRYDGQLGEDQYPNINSFLTYAVMHFDLLVHVQEKLWERYYEESHSGGIFTIRIV